MHTPRHNNNAKCIRTTTNGKIGDERSSSSSNIERRKVGMKLSRGTWTTTEFISSIQRLTKERNGYRMATSCS
ncbi:hypothetical protein QE152_g31152 [Popillia japonica]|uniref:Uncharacterized protein n=1 Tax=Popillia japonica TaxID=7064 RepID=A0AAW1JC83_POPJA